MPPESSSDLNTHPSLSFLSAPILKTYASSLKPVLKKTIQPSNIMMQKDYWLTNDRYWSKCVSESGKQSVRFNPNITQVKYLPETPVKESFSKKSTAGYFNLDSEGEEDEDEDEEDDEDIWNVIIQVGSYLKSALFSSLFGKKQTQQIIKTPNRDLVQFCVSAVSFTAWIMYQTFSAVFNRTLFTKTATTTQQIKPQVAKKSLLERKNTSTSAGIITV